MKHHCKFLISKKRIALWSAIITSIVMFLLLIANIWLGHLFNHSSNTIYLSHIKYSDSLFIQMEKKIPTPCAPSLRHIRCKDTTTQKALEQIALSNDSLAHALAYYKLLTHKLVQDNEVRQNDIRQETNNIINKINGDLSFWIFILSVICGFVPLAIGLYNAQQDAKFIKQVSEANDRLMSSYKQHIDNALNIHIEKTKEQIEIYRGCYEKLEEDWKMEKQNNADFQSYLTLMQNYVRITTLTRRSQFQGSYNRKAITEGLLYTMAINGPACLKSKLTKDNGYLKIAHCIAALLDGFELLEPFIETRTTGKLIWKAIEKLRRAQEYMDKGNIINEELLDEICVTIENLGNSLPAKIITSS